MAKLKSSYRLKGSTLVEVLVAMTLISISLALGFMIYNNLLSSHRMRLQQTAHIMLEHLAEEIKSGKPLTSTEITRGEISIRHQYNKYDSNEELTVLMLVAFDSKNKKLAERKEIIRIDP